MRILIFKTLPSGRDKYKVAATLAEHRKRCVEGVRFECESCKKSFVSRRNLREHVTAVHTKEKPHACPECGRGFHKASNLKSHIATHYAEWVAMWPGNDVVQDPDDGANAAHAVHNQKEVQNSSENIDVGALLIRIKCLEEQVAKDKIIKKKLKQKIRHLRKRNSNLLNVMSTLPPVLPTQQFQRENVEEQLYIKQEGNNQCSDDPEGSMFQQEDGSNLKMNENIMDPLSLTQENPIKTEELNIFKEDEQCTSISQQEDQDEKDFTDGGGGSNTGRDKYKVAAKLAEHRKRCMEGHIVF